MAQYKKGVLFQGNVRVRKPGIVLQWDEAQVAEFMRCAQDPLHFIENYVWIKNVDSEELILFKPRSYQIEMINKMMENRYSITKLPRQAGKTSIVSAVLLWYLIFNKNYSILVAAHKGDKARDIIGVLKEMFENLPEFLQHGVDEWNKGNFKLENGSRVRASATSASSARGDVYNFVYIDEAGFIQTHIAEEFFKSVIPTISSGKTTKISITSTPKGLNHFYTMWTAAVQGKSGYAWTEIKWNDVPGRDEKFRSEVIAQFGEDYFNQEFGAEFLGSSATLISAQRLLQMALEIEPPVLENAELTHRVFLKPVPGRHYAVTVDTSEGLGQDATCVVVFDVTEMPYQIASIYQDKYCDPFASLPGIILNLASVYNEAMVLVEANFGQQIADILLFDLAYEHVILTTRKQRRAGMGQVTLSTGSTASRPGIFMDKLVKHQGCTTLKSLVENRQLIVKDQAAYNELCRFAVKKRSYAAESGHDDLAMCLVMFAWLSDQGYLRAATDVSARENLAKMQADRIENEMTPVGLVFRGEELPSERAPRADNDWGWLLGDNDPEPEPWTMEQIHRMLGRFPGS